MRFCILGPLEVWEDGHQLELSAGRPRALLLLLLVHANEVVATERLIEELWNGSPPPTANKVVQNYVSQLRKLIGEEVLLTRAGGYLLRAAETDACEFEVAVEAASAQAPAEAARTLRASLALWRGSPLPEVEYEPWAQAEIGRLEELRLAAIEERTDAELQLGKHTSIAPELEALVGEHPLRERLCAQLMLALYRSGRQADALAAYARARRRLVDELGIEPGRELQDLQRRILAQDAGLDGTGRALALARRRIPLALMFAGAALLLGAVAAVLVVELTARSGAGIALAADSLGAIDPSSYRVTADYQVAGEPTRLTSNGRLLWIGGDGSRTISAVDPRSHTITRLVSLQGFPTALGGGGGAVWVVDGRSGLLTKIEPAYGLTGRTRIAAANPAYDESREAPDPTSIASSGRSVWITDGSDRLIHVDDTSTRIIGTLDLHQPLDGVAVAGTTLWVISGPSASVLRVDSRTGRITARIQIASSPGFESPYPLAIAVGEGAVWVLNGNTATLTKIDPSQRAVSTTIPIGVEHEPARLAVGDGAAWVAGSDGTLLRIDSVSSAIHTVSLARPLRDVAVADGRVWVTTGSGLATPAAATPSAAYLRALPAATCSPVYDRGGAPQYLIVADLPLQGFERVLATQTSEAIQFLLKQRGFRAGRYTVGYQACDDSTISSGFASPARCAANAHTYAADPSVIGVIGPLDSYCARVEVPITNRAPAGALPMISVTNTYIGLTHPGPGAGAHEPQRYYPTGIRNYVRIIAPDDVQAAADALLAKRLGITNIYVVRDQPGNGYGAGLADAFAIAAHKLDLAIVGTGTWNYANPSPNKLAIQAQRLHAQAVFIAAGAIDDPPIGTLIDALHAAGIRIIAPDAFSEFGKLIQFAGAAAEGVLVSVPGLPTQRLPKQGSVFVAAFGRAVGQTPTQYAVYSAAAAAVLLDAIAHSNGTRNSVREHLFTTKANTGILGTLAFNNHGDTTTDDVTVYQIVGGTPRVVYVLIPPTRLVEGSGSK
jgi:DNA-binding SARP family transcriptional activator/ABC-type branched-subunit amino acid transport system substrate-binding protein